MKLGCPKCGGGVVKRGTKPNGSQRYYCHPCDWHGTNAVGIEEAKREGIDRKASKALHSKVRKAKDVQRYVITSAQNATPINEQFFGSLRTYCIANNAQLLVIPYRYKNPTSLPARKKQDRWAEELKPYILAERTPIGKSVVILADIMTQPTATSPLSGFETLVGGRSAIIGHPKLELVTVPTPQSRLPKILTTTGAVTVKNYIPGKAGKKAEHHHTYGACVLEVDGDTFHIRQINAVKDGSFMDLDMEYTPLTVRAVERAAALVMGDSHVEFIDPVVVQATFGKGGILDVLKPEHLVWHDVHDFYSRNHHHKHEVFVNYVKHHAGTDNVEEALNDTFAFINKNSRSSIKNVFVPSNHPDALGRWVKETDPRLDPENCVFWARTFQAMCEGSSMTNTGARTIDPFRYWAEKALTTPGVFLSRDESMRIQGIEVGYHGDRGPNGARGSRNAFSKIGVKTVIGHSHSPGIRDGAYQTGTSSHLRLEYNSGPSSWLQTHCVIYANGKRSLINIINGKWKS